MKTVFKIMKDGKYSTGSMNPKFNDKGKIWNSRGAVSGHLTQFSDGEIKKYYDGAVIVELETIIIDKISVIGDHERRKENTRIKNVKEQERYSAARLAHIKQEFKNLINQK